MKAIPMIVFPDWIGPWNIVIFVPIPGVRLSIGWTKYGYRPKFTGPVILLYSGDSIRCCLAICDTNKCGVGFRA
jgi:hypothetical protein